jgi:hypothetical protein
MHPHHGGHEHGMGTHNMAVVGERRIYLSHLPMFMPPHNAQLILEATFMRNGKSVDDVYFADRAANRSITFYTLTPEEFALRELFEGMPPPRTHFKATVFRGHLEKGGTPIDLLTGVDVRITRVVHAHTFDGMDKLPALTHILFGSNDDLLLAHFVSKAPDFDQILSVTATGGVPTADELQHGPTAEMLGRANQAKSRLTPGETAVARCHVTGAHQFLNVNVSVRAELYFEEGELSSTRSSDKLFQQTEGEKKAGFV